MAKAARLAADQRPAPEPAGQCAHVGQIGQGDTRGELQQQGIGAQDIDRIVQHDPRRDDDQQRPRHQARARLRQGASRAAAKTR